MNVVRRLIALAVCGVAAGAAEEPPVQMEPVRVEAVWASAEVRVDLERTAGGIVLARTRVVTVRPHSAAERVGLELGMEIVAIQGVLLRGLTEDEFDEIMHRPAKGEIVLTVRRKGATRTQEIRIPLAKPRAG